MEERCLIPTNIKKTKCQYVHSLEELHLYIIDVNLLSTQVVNMLNILHTSRWLFNGVGCTFGGFSIFLLALNEINTHAAIAVCRYVTVCKPGYGK